MPKSPEILTTEVLVIGKDVVLRSVSVVLGVEYVICGIETLLVFTRLVFRVNAALLVIRVDAVLLLVICVSLVINVCSSNYYESI